MINWLNLLFNSIWILAMSLALAVLSIVYYQAKQESKKISTYLNSPRYAFTLNIAGGLFCFGLALTADRWWEIIIWIVLMGLFSYQAWMVKNDSRRKTEDGNLDLDE